MFDYLKKKLFGAVYNGPETPEYPEKQRITPVSSADDPNMGFVYAGPDPFVRLDGPAYPENQTMGISAPVDASEREPRMMPVYAGPSAYGINSSPAYPANHTAGACTPVDEPVMNTVYAGPDAFIPREPDSMHMPAGIPAPPPENRGYIRLDHPQYRQQVDLGCDRELIIGRTGWGFPIPKEMQPTVSREHCTVSYSSWRDFFTVVDLNSTNGVISRDMVLYNGTVYVIGNQAIQAVNEMAGRAVGSGYRWQQVGYRLPAGKQVWVSPGTSLRIGTMQVTLWSEKNHERWG